jgi:hypothetical protein
LPLTRWRLTFAPVQNEDTVERRPIHGSGSCARCQASLDLASLKREGVWYCSFGCADGRVSEQPRQPRVPEPWLYGRPRRYFGARAPKELRSRA